MFTPRREAHDVLSLRIVSPTVSSILKNAVTDDDERKDMASPKNAATVDGWEDGYERKGITFRAALASRLRRIFRARNRWHSRNTAASLIILFISLLLFTILIVFCNDKDEEGTMPKNKIHVGLDAPPNKAPTQSQVRTSNEKQTIKLSMDNILWSRNWYHHAECPDVPDEYYSLQHAKDWCKHPFLTECVQKVENLKSWFQSCQGTIWIRSQTHKQEKKGDLANFVSEVLPLIQHPFDLITTDGDNAHPYDLVNHQILLNNSYLKTWYTQNYDYDYDGGDESQSNKIQPVPLGLDLHTVSRFDKRNSSEMLEEMLALREWSKENHANRSASFYIPPMSGSDRERGRAMIATKCLGSARTQRTRLSYLKLLEQYSKHRFGLSPPGNGNDCHRTWEMLMFGMIPVVKSSGMDLLYKKFDLPVVIVKDWEELCQDGFLDRQYERFKDKVPLDNAKLTTGYYIGRLSSFEMATAGDTTTN